MASVASAERRCSGWVDQRLRVKEIETAANRRPAGCTSMLWFLMLSSGCSSLTADCMASGRGSLSTRTSITAFSLTRSWHRGCDILRGTMLGVSGPAGSGTPQIYSMCMPSVAGPAQRHCAPLFDKSDSTQALLLVNEFHRARRTLVTPASPVPPLAQVRQHLILSRHASSCGGHCGRTS